MASSQMPRRTKTLFQGIDVGDHSSPAALDWDGDGFKDLVVGNNHGTLDDFFNGSQDGTLAKATPDQVPFQGIDVGDHSSPAALDWDGDGFKDLVVDNNHGTLDFFKGSQDGTLAKATPDQIPFQGIDVGDHSSLAAQDWDGDGFNDLILGNNSGTLDLFRVGLPECCSVLWWTRNLLAPHKQL